ncbi:MAG: DNA helicase RecQ [Verrucomicrobiota bacterium]|nr:DNA helicase RecQ [Verrucomicrobiota bacterium]
MIKSKLKEVFGFDSFLDNQGKIVEAIVKRRDVFAVMPTGAGKSLCYQLPSILMDGVCIVISPLIALMKDQVDGARENGIRAAYFNSTMISEERGAVMEALRFGNIDLLYISPERLSMDYFVDMLKNISISFFAIDEAHCISEWGHNFRPDYLVLSELRKLFPNTPIAAFTASATDKVKKDIALRLNLNEPLLIEASYDRPNLFYQSERKRNVDKQILDFIGKYKNAPGIVYRTTRKNVESTAEFLKSKNINVLPYHAGMDNIERQRNQDAFNNDKIQVIVATIAFGMGIDKSNIRFVIHGDMPKDIESYYQETGRAGRDGEIAQCLLLHSFKDENTHNYFISLVEDKVERKRRTYKLSQMVKFATLTRCRRKTLLNYFGERYEKKNCGGCDVCLGEPKLVDSTRDAQILMSAIARTNERFGINHIVKIVRGSEDKQIKKFGHYQLPTHGAGKHLSQADCMELFGQLSVAGAIKKHIEEQNRISLTTKGRDILFGRKKFQILKAISKAKRTSSNSFIDYDKDLFAELRSLRTGIASEQKVPPYIVFSDKSLHEMCRKFPVNKQSMLNIGGVGQKKLRDYGQTFIEVIQNYLEDNPDIKLTQPSNNYF